MTIEDKMMKTIDVAKISLRNGEFPVGAIIFCEDEIIGSAHSSGETSKKYLRHAEMKVLWEADMKQYSVRQRKGMQLFVTLEPCMMCLGAAMAFFIGEIYYALESPIDGAVSFAEQLWCPDNKELREYNLPKVYGGILKEESKKLLQQYIDIKETGSLVEFSKRLLQL